MKTTDSAIGIRHGFTLIELSIVLVIIGLIAGAIVVGQDLISAAEIRATVAQIEKYNASVNTFRGKYGYIPGDIPDPIATQFGFSKRGTNPGEGDGNGVLEGVYPNEAMCGGWCIGQGETAVFWHDLSDAKLVDGGFTAASAYIPLAGNVNGPDVGLYFPTAKFGKGNYIFAWSGGYTPTQGLRADGKNYFGLSAVTNIYAFNTPDSNTTITPQQAYNMDAKVDDGLPQSGSVLALYLTTGTIKWAGADSRGWGPGSGSPIPLLPGQPSAATQADDTTCYDNNNVANGQTRYSTSYANGSSQTCALSFRFQ